MTAVPIIKYTGHQKQREIAADEEAKLGVGDVFRLIDVNAGIFSLRRMIIT